MGINPLNIYVFQYCCKNCPSKPFARFEETVTHTHNLCAVFFLLPKFNFQKKKKIANLRKNPKEKKTRKPSTKNQKNKNKMIGDYLLNKDIGFQYMILPHKMRWMSELFSLVIIILIFLASLISFFKTNVKYPWVWLYFQQNKTKHKTKQYILTSFMLGLCV